MRDFELVRWQNQQVSHRPFWKGILDGGASFSAMDSHSPSLILSRIASLKVPLQPKDTLTSAMEGFV